MKKTLFFFALLLAGSVFVTANAADLIEVYQQAMTSDPTYQQSIAQTLATEEDVPINRAALLPNAGLAITPSVLKSMSSGPASYLGSYTQRGYQVQLTLTQTIFNFAQFAALSGAHATAKQADATLNAAVQSLIVRVAEAYFQVLQDEDNLASVRSTKAAYTKQLDQVTEQYKVGLKTITDVYTAEASFESSSANEIAAINQIAMDRENLRVITGVLYPHLSKLSENFPMISPNPSDIDAWVSTAKQQNWSIKAAQFAAEAARQNIKQQFAGNLPSLNVQGAYNIIYTRTSGGDPTLGNVGSSQTHSPSASLNLTVPLFEGGQVLAETNQAKYQYQAAEQQLEQTLRNTMNQARQSYLGIMAGISKIEADKKAIKSARSSYKGLEAGYHVGTQTLVNVLTQQQEVLQAELRYAMDRYAYVNHFLALKQAAGTLSPDDLAGINAWLLKEDNV